MLKKRCMIKCMSGIVYLVQPCELLNTRRYKVGMSKKNTLDRVNKGYKRGTRYLNIQEVRDPERVEGKLLKSFNRNFRKIAGREYFEGSEKKMRNEFVKIVNGEVNSSCCKRWLCYTINLMLVGFAFGGGCYLCKQY